VTDYASAARRYEALRAHFHEMLARGRVPGALAVRGGFVSLAQTDADIALAGRAAAQALTVG